MNKKAEKDGNGHRFYREIIENMAEGVFLIRQDGVIVYANPTIERIFGYDPGELIGKHTSILDASTNKSAEEIAHEIQQKLEANRIWQGEVKNIKKDGTIVWCFVNISTIEHPKYGNVWIAINQDITERKQVEDALSGSEERLYQVIEQMPYPVEICDSSGTAKMVNQAFLKLFGISSADMVVDKYNVFKDRLTMDVLELADDIHRVYSGESVFVPELVLPLKKYPSEFGIQPKEDIVLETTMFPVLRSTGEIWRVVTIWKDITERKHAEEALRKSENTLRVWLNAIQESAFLIDQEGIVLAANTTVAERMHHSVEEMIGKCIFDFVPPEVARIRRSYLAEVIASGKPARFEDERSGRIIDNLIYPVFDQDGRIRQLAVMATDVTERKQMEENLRRQEQEYKTLVEHTPDVIVRFDQQYRHSYVNPVVEKEFGIPPAKLLGKSHRELGQPPEKAEWSERIISQVFETGQEVIFEMDNPTPSGDEYYLSRGVPEFAEDGSVSSVLFIHRNITERKQVEEALHKSEERFRLIAETIQEVFWMADVDLQRMLYVSPSYEQVWGRSCESLYNSPQSFLDAIHPEDRARVLIDLEAEKTGLPFEHEYQIIRPDGSIHWIWDRGFPIL
jgi:PAS domain S-box-containing protein